MEVSLWLSLVLDISAFNSSKSCKYSQTHSNVSLTSKKWKDVFESNILKYIDETESKSKSNENENDTDSYVVLKNTDILTKLEKGENLDYNV
jgi:predicted transcriptional regulator